MQKLVTIAVPIYKRLEFLPRILKAVSAQTYPGVELLISDNGVNGNVVRDQVKRLYSRPHVFRQNPASVDVMQHFNQLLQAARGDYFMIVPDDDEITPNFAAELVGLLEKHPRAMLGFGRQETVAADGSVLAKSIDQLPEKLSGPDFIRATWQKYAFGFQSVSTFLARTEPMKAFGGFPHFTRGTHIDDAVVVKLSLLGEVVFSSHCVFRNLVQDSSLGWSMSTAELASGVRQFMRFLDTDETVRQFAAQHPAEWEDLRNCLIGMSWGMYLGRWQNIYRQRLPYHQWARAAFAMPLIPSYYKRALRVLARATRDLIKSPNLLLALLSAG